MQAGKFILATAMAAALVSFTASAQTPSRPVTLHVNPRWEQCSIQLDPSLTQQAWRQFTREAGLVAYFRPLTDARPLGPGNYDVSIVQWGSAIDESQPAWNDTFVHPDSAHWLIGGDRLPFPGLSARAGVTDKINVGAYVTKSIGANYGFWGGQVQYTVANDAVRDWSAAARLGFTSVFGPDDLDMTVYGLDLLGSAVVARYSDWVRLSAYAGVSTYLARSHERSPVVTLADESVLGGQAMVGAIAEVSIVRLAVEYNVAAINTVSMRVGVGF